MSVGLEIWMASSSLALGHLEFFCQKNTWLFYGVRVSVLSTATFEVFPFL